MITYHQEFDLNIFHYEPSKERKKIYSFINCLNTEELYKDDWRLFLELEKLMPDWEFKSFGGQCRDGAIWDRRELADKMREATFIFQVKKNGDGYGHNIFSAAAVGRPLIVRASDYKGKLAEPLIDQYTSIIIDNKMQQQIAEEIEATYYLTYEKQNFNLHPNLVEQGENIYKNFKEICNFDKEEQQIRSFLENLQ